MKNMLVIVTLMAAATPSLSAQVEGDSIRLRVPPSREWTFGRFVALDGERITINHADGNQSYSLQALGRFEVRRRKNVAATLLAPTLGALAGAGAAILTRPANRESIFGSDTKALAVSAGIGLVIGVIDLSVSPWRWKRVRLGVRAAT